MVHTEEHEESKGSSQIGSKMKSRPFKRKKILHLKPIENNVSREFLNFKIRPPNIQPKLKLNKKAEFSSFHIHIHELGFQEFKVHVEEFHVESYELEKWKKRMNILEDKIFSISDLGIGQYDSTLPRINLFHENLNQLISHFHSEGLLHQDIYDKFLEDQGENLTGIDLECLQENGIQNSFFNEIDHRILSIILSKYFPYKYEIVTDGKSINTPFYEMSLSEYSTLWNKFNRDFRGYWMPSSYEFISNFKCLQRVPALKTEKKINRPHASLPIFKQPKFSFKTEIEFFGENKSLDESGKEENEGKVCEV